MGIRNFLFGWRDLGIERNDLVLEVGSGNRPIARSDVLCDMGEFSRMDQFGGLMPVAAVRDRPFVFADAHRLPFRDHAFDYLYSAHMLEHLERPAEFLAEAQRVAARGCIVTPSPTFEHMFAERTHCWYVDVDEGVLKLDAKAPGDHGLFGERMQHLFDESWHLRQVVWSRADVFETRYHFDSATLRWAINGVPRPNVPDATEPVAAPAPVATAAGQAAAAMRSLLGAMIRVSQGRRGVDLGPLLACVECRAPVVHDRAASSIGCTHCGMTYPVDAGGAPVMLSQVSRRGVASASVPSSAHAAHKGLGVSHGAHP